jgi:uncharacterized protein
VIIILSPSKTLDFDTELPIHYTVPDTLVDSQELIAGLKKLSVMELCSLMSISEKLGALNYQRYQDFSVPFTPKNAKQAIAVFQGDVYDGLGAKHFTTTQLEYAQQHLRILSGLYGLLRPLDLIQPYRLEMGTQFKNMHGKNLYAFWGDKITGALNNALEAEGNQAVLINLASAEYFKAVQPKKINASIVTPVFKEKKGNSYKVVMVYAKHARGKMAGHIIKHQIKKPESIKEFSEDGYRFNPALSNKTEWVFVR